MRAVVVCCLLRCYQNEFDIYRIPCCRCFEVDAAEQL